MAERSCTRCQNAILEDKKQYCIMSDKVIWAEGEGLDDTTCFLYKEVVKDATTP